MTLAFNACANCLHFESDAEPVGRFLNGRLREVYLHRCGQHPEREDAGAVHEECFVSRAEAERIASSFVKPAGRADGLIQGELF